MYVYLGLLSVRWDCGCSSAGESSVWTSRSRFIFSTWSAAGSITPTCQLLCRGGWLMWPALLWWPSSASTCACRLSSGPFLWIPAPNPTYEHLPYGQRVHSEQLKGLWINWHDLFTWYFQLCCSVNFCCHRIQIGSQFWLKMDTSSVISKFCHFIFFISV